MAQLLDKTRIYGNAFVDTNLYVSGTTVSTGKTSGAVTIGGGLGVADSIWAGSIQGTPIGSISREAGFFTNISTTGYTTIGGSLSASSISTTGSMTGGNVYVRDNLLWFGNNNPILATDVGQLTDYNNLLTGGSIIKTFNLLGTFTSPIIGTAVWAPTGPSVIRAVQLTNGAAAGSDLMVGLYKNGALMSFFTLNTGNFVQRITGLSINVAINDYFTVNVVAGSGLNFSLTLLTN